MSGLRPDCDEFAPWGYNSSLQPLARKVEVPVVPPSEYNKHAIPPPPWARLHVPVPAAGPMKVPLRTQDRYGNMSANPSPFPVSNPLDFNKNAIGTNYNQHMPELIPWSKDTAKDQVVESTSGGNIEPPKKDLKAVAEEFIKTVIDPRQKYWWEQRINSLTQLEAIELTRGLNGED